MQQQDNVEQTPTLPADDGVQTRPFETPRVEDLGHLRDLTLQLTGGGGG
jgi:hypothetical protein